MYLPSHFCSLTPVNLAQLFIYVLWIDCWPWSILMFRTHSLKVLCCPERGSFPIFHSCREPPPTEGARDRNIRELKVLGLLAGSPEGRLWAFRACLTLSFVSLALRPCDPRKVYLLFPPLFPVIPNNACVHNLVSMMHVSRVHKSWCIFQWYTYPYKYKYTRIHGACMCPRSTILYPWLLYPWSCIHDACMHVSKIHVSMVFTQVWHGQHRWSIIES